MVCPVCTQDMIKSKVGHLCLNCGNLVEHGSAIKPEHHEVHHEAKKPAPARKPAARKSAGTKIAVKTRTVSDLKRTHS